MLKLLNNEVNASETVHLHYYKLVNTNKLDLELFSQRNYRSGNSQFYNQNRNWIKGSPLLSSKIIQSLKYGWFVLETLGWTRSGPPWTRRGPTLDSRLDQIWSNLDHFLSNLKMHEKINICKIFFQDLS